MSVAPHLTGDNWLARTASSSWPTKRGSSAHRAAVTRWYGSMRRGQCPEVFSTCKDTRPSNSKGNSGRSERSMLTFAFCGFRQRLPCLSSITFSNVRRMTTGLLELGEFTDINPTQHRACHRITTTLSSKPPWNYVFNECNWVFLILRKTVLTSSSQLCLTVRHKQSKDVCPTHKGWQSAKEEEIF